VVDDDDEEEEGSFSRLLRIWRTASSRFVKENLFSFRRGVGTLFAAGLSSSSANDDDNDDDDAELGGSGGCGSELTST